MLHGKRREAGGGLLSSSHPGPRARVGMAKDSIQSTSKGWMPGVSKIAVPASNFSVGNSGRKAAVLHIVEGSAGSALHEFTAPTQKSSHFVVSNTGAIWQLVSVLDTAYANGLSYKAGHWIDPEGNVVNPPWQGLTPPINPNFQTISIEREGYYQEQPSAAENAAVVRILQYVHSAFPSLIPAWSFMQTLIGHCHISPVARKNCPGPHVDYAGIAAAANGTPTPPVPRAYRIKGLPIYQQQSLSGPLAGVLETGEVVMVDQTYPNGAAHDKLGRGFFDLDGAEAL